MICTSLCALLLCLYMVVWKKLFSSFEFCQVQICSREPNPKTRVHMYVHACLCKNAPPNTLHAGHERGGETARAAGQEAAPAQGLGNPDADGPRPRGDTAGRGSGGRLDGQCARALAAGLEEVRQNMPSMYICMHMGVKGGPVLVFYVCRARRGGGVEAGLRHLYSQSKVAQKH